MLTHVSTRLAHHEMPLSTFFRLEPNYKAHLGRFFSERPAESVRTLVKMQLRLASILCSYFNFFAVSDFHSATGLPTAFAYIFLFGFIVTCLGLVYALYGVGIGRLDFPDDKPVTGLGIIRYDVYAPGHLLAPPLHKYKSLQRRVQFIRIMTEWGFVLEMAVIVLLLFTVPWRVWKWWNFKPDAWVESAIPEL